MNNKARAESIPQGNKEDPRGFARSAINVDIDSAGKVRDRPGYTQLYAGDCHSVYNRYFVEEGDLKYLNTDNTAATIKTGVGDEKISYCAVAGRIYFSSPVISGSIINDNYRKWGVARPQRQPTVTQRSSGNMHGGEYQVAITWMREGEESGAILSSRVAVDDGGGIVLSNFPVPSDDIDQVAVYVSSINGKELYLFGQFPANGDEIYIDKHISDITINTQFGRTPDAFPIIEYHYGRIYGAIDNRVHYSNPHNYGLFNPNQYWHFPGRVTCLISVPGAFYVGTAEKIYRVSNIDGEGSPVNTVAKDYGIVNTLNTCYDTDNEVAYITSTKGLCAVTNEGITEITAKNVAMDEYGNTVLTVVEQDGHKKLISVNQNIIKVSGLKAKT